MIINPNPIPSSDFELNQECYLSRDILNPYVPVDDIQLYKKGTKLIVVSISYNEFHFCTKENYDKLKDNSIISSDFSIDYTKVQDYIETVHERRKRIIKNILK